MHNQLIIKVGDFIGIFFFGYLGNSFDASFQVSLRLKRSQVFFLQYFNTQNN